MLRAFLFSLVFILFGCATRKEVSTTISVEIIPESNVGDYALVWKDTLGKADSKEAQTFLMNRTNELYCYILNNQQDTLGYYRGLSTPRQWTYFQTKTPKDSLVYLHFSVGINHFSTLLSKYTKKEIRQFNRINKRTVQFKPVIISLDTALRIPYSLTLMEEKRKGLH